MAFKIGEAYVEVNAKVNKDGIRRDIESALGDAEKSASTFSTRIGRTIDDNISKSAANAGKSIEQHLTRNFASASAEGGILNSKMASLVSVAATAAPQILAVGAGLAAFGALAAPSIMQVVSATEDLAGSWSSLSVEQKAAVILIKDLVREYGALSKALEPQTFNVFNSGLTLTNALLPKLSPLAEQAAQSLTKLIDSWAAGLDTARADQFFSFLQQNIGPGLANLGEVLGSVIGLFVSLTEALGPVAGVGLQAVGVIADLAAEVIDAVPALAQFVAIMIAVRAPINALSGLFGGVSGKFESYSSNAKSASIATKALNVVTSAGPNLYVAAGVAIASLAVGMMSAQSSTDKLVTSLTIANNAVGNNVSGYQKLSNTLNTELLSAMTNQTASYQKVIDSGGRLDANTISNAESSYKHKLASESLTAAIEATNQKITTINASADFLGKTYGTTRDEAIRLATAAGVDLTVGLNTGSEAAVQAESKIRNYIVSVEQAKNPTAVVAQAWRDASNDALSLRDRTAALTQAFDAYFTPALNVLTATNNLKTSWQQAKKAADDSKMSVTQKNTVLASHLSTLKAFADAEFQSTGKVREASQKMLEQVSTLTRLAGGTKEGTSAVNAFITSMGGSVRKAGEATIATDKFGNSVKVLPNGKTVDISAKVAAAREALAATKRDIDNIPRNKSVSITVNTIYNGSESARAAILAKNTYETGAIHKYASGAIRRVTPPMIASGPTTLFGEGRDDEAFIPYDKAFRSRATKLLNAVANDFGYQLAPAGAKAASGGNTTNYFNVTIPSRDIAEMKTASDFFNKAQSLARSGAR